MLLVEKETSLFSFFPFISLQEQGRKYQAKSFELFYSEIAKRLKQAFVNSKPKVEKKKL